MPVQRDYYEVLGVARGASDAAIKKAYRELARKLHPDVVSDKDKTPAEARFKEINEAYAVLSDPEKRARYDRFGSAGPQPGFGFGGEGFGDIFDLFFGGGVGRRRAGPERGADLRYDLEVSLQDALNGAEREISFTYLGRCDVCRGNGSADGSPPSQCPECRGSGQVRTVRNTMLGQFVATSTCANCGGTGGVITNPCRSCRGRGRKEQHRKLKVHVPAGVEDQTRLRYADAGEAGERGGPNGDLYVYLTVRPHDVFERRGPDLRCDTAISFTQAALGATLEIEGLDGPVTVQIPAGTQTGTTFRVGGRGLPRMRGGGRGDLFVDVQVRVPTKLTRKQKEILAEFARAGGEDVEDKGFFEKVKEAFGGE